MLGHPAFVSALIGGYAQSKALFAQQNVSAVTGVDRNNGVVLGELADISLFLVDVAFAVKSSDPVVAVAENVKNGLAHSCHDCHVEHNINGIGDFDTDLGKLGANGTHGVRNYIHGSALIAVSCDVGKHFIGFAGLHPVVGGACLLLGGSADKGAALNTGNVVNGGAVEVASGELFLVELDHFAGSAGFLAELLKLLLAAVDPNDLFGLYKLDLLVKPLFD